jgi:hypothetical protein
MNDTIKKAIQNGMDYQQYRSLISDLLAKNKTTGPNQTEAFINYTRMNDIRMTRLDKTCKILPESEKVLSAINTHLVWLIITEAWCGDAAQIVPVINKLATVNPKIQVKHVLRDENEDLMNLFLTNGGKSIPIIVLIDEKKEEVLRHWGPRPSFIQSQVMARKNDPDASPYSEFVVEVQKWYAKDKTRTIQREFLNLPKDQ